MTSISNLKVYTTQPHPCSYIADREATTLFIDPQAIITRQIYSHLSESGFRRSGGHLYAPHCRECQACVPVRIPVDRFVQSKSQKKIWRRNQDLNVTNPPHIKSAPYYELYHRYINDRHFDGDMYPPSRDQYESFLTREWELTRYYAFWLENQLKAVAVVDILDNGLSSVYTYFDTTDNRRSLGSYCILWQVELAISLKLPSVYLGYWIKNCDKMSYKSNFRPLEYYIHGQWLCL